MPSAHGDRIAKPRKITTIVAGFNQEMKRYNIKGAIELGLPLAIKRKYKCSYKLIRSVHLQGDENGQMEKG